MIRVRKALPELSDLFPHEHLLTHSKHCGYMQVRICCFFLQRKNRKNYHSKVTCEAHKQTLRARAGCAAGLSCLCPRAGLGCCGCVCCSQHSATAEQAGAGECKGRLCHFTTPVLSLAASTMGEGRAITTWNTKGKSHTASYQLHSQQLLPIPFLKGQSFLNAGGGNEEEECKQTTSCSAKAMSPVYCLNWSESHYRAMRMHIKRTERKDEN